MLETNLLDITYIDAWSRWLAGESVANYYLWNVRILWLGRAGKLVGFLSAFAIIAEVIGSKRLREFGASLHDRLTLQKTLDRVKNRFSLLLLIPRMISAKTNEESDELFQKFYVRTLTGWMTMISVHVVAAIVGYRVYQSKDFLWALGAWLLAAFIGVYLFPLLITLLLSTPMLALLLMDFLVIEPVAWLLERESLDSLIKLGSFILLIIGFHFDLLAS